MSKSNKSKAIDNSLTDSINKILHDQHDQHDLHDQKQGQTDNTTRPTSAPATPAGSIAPVVAPVASPVASPVVDNQTKPIKKPVMSMAERGRLGGRRSMVEVVNKKLSEEDIELNKIKLKYSLELAVKQHVKGQAEELAKVSGVPVKYASQLLTSKKAFIDWRGVKRRALDVKGVGVLDQLLTTISGGHLSPYQAGMLYSMLHDKIFRVKKSDGLTNVVNVGDNRRVSVYYPNFSPKDKTKEFENIGDPKPPKDTT